MAVATSNHGHSEDRPKVLGRADGEPAILVEATGAYEGLKVGQQRWVTGTGVDRGLGLGIIMELHPSPAATAEPDVQVVVEAEPKTPAEPAAPVAKPTFDPSEHNAKDTLAYLAAVDDDAEVARVKKLERAGKKRKTVLDY